MLQRERAGWVAKHRRPAPQTPELREVAMLLVLLAVNLHEQRVLIALHSCCLCATVVVCKTGRFFRRDCIRRSRLVVVEFRPFRARFARAGTQVPTLVVVSTPVVELLRLEEKHDVCFDIIASVSYQWSINSVSHGSSEQRCNALTSSREQHIHELQVRNAKRSAHEPRQVQRQVVIRAFVRVEPLVKVQRVLGEQRAKEPSRPLVHGKREPVITLLLLDRQRDHLGR